MCYIGVFLSIKHEGSESKPNSLRHPSWRLIKGRDSTSSSRSIEYRCENILPRCSLGRKVNSFKDFDRQTQAWQDQMRDFCFFPRRKKEKIETKYPLLVVWIGYVILLFDMTLRWSVYSLRGENLSSDIVIVIVIIIANFLFIYFFIKTKILLTIMTSEKRSSYLNFGKACRVFFFIYMKIISDSKMYINMSYSLFIFNIFLKEWGDIKSSRGTKRFGRGWDGPVH